MDQLGPDLRTESLTNYRRTARWNDKTGGGCRAAPCPRSEGQLSRRASEALVVLLGRAYARAVRGDWIPLAGGDTWPFPEGVWGGVAELAPLSTVLAGAPTGGPVWALDEPVVPALRYGWRFYCWRLCRRRFPFVNRCTLRHLSGHPLPPGGDDPYRQDDRLAEFCRSVKLSTLK